MNVVQRLVVVLLFGIVLAPAYAQAPAALAGKVSSAEEGAMEGVLVSAKKAGSTITVTVVSDAEGRYSFPAGRLSPGKYALKVRAAGYELESPTTIQVGKSTTADLKLRRTGDLAAQLSNGEWITSMPGDDRQKGQLLNCVGCHTLERVARSRYDADTFTKAILPRMQGYVNQSIPQHPQLRKAERLMEERGDQRVQVYRSTAEYLSTVNLAERHQYGVRPAARDDRAARRDRRQAGDRLVLELRRAESRAPRSEDRQGHGICDQAAQARLPDGAARPARGPRRQPVARQHVPGRHREVRQEDAEVHLLAAAEGAEHRRGPAEHGEPAVRARRRQGVDAEQRLRRRAPARHRHRQDRDLGAVQGRAERRAAQHLRRRSGLQEQRLVHRLPPQAHRPHRRENRRDPDLRNAGERCRDRTAPRADGCAGSPVVRAVPRRQDRHARHQDRRVQGLGGRPALVGAPRRRLRQET